MSSLKGTIEQIITNSGKLPEKMAGYRALWQIGDQNQVITDAKSASTLLDRTAAANVWIGEDAAAAAPTSVDLLKKSESLDAAESIFIAFRRVEDGPARMVEALAGRQIPENIANVGLQIAQTSGLGLAEWEEAIRKAGNIKPLGEMGREDKDTLIAEAIQMENVSRGQRLFRSRELLCAACHRVGDLGGLIGPDLTTVGSYMTPNALLESILNPNSDIKQNYETLLVSKTNGEIVSGILERKTNNSTLLRQANDQIIEIPQSDITKVEVSPVSLMPPGLTRNLSRDELRDLLSYLISLGSEN
jgi:putative heme-binding domain-containing protein